MGILMVVPRLCKMAMLGLRGVYSCGKGMVFGRQQRLRVAVRWNADMQGNRKQELSRRRPLRRPK
jgi:hypothetical protein